jgi:hypothetical protein
MGDKKERISAKKVSESYGANLIKLFTVVIYELAKLSRVSVPGKPFQTSLVFPSKV